MPFELAGVVKFTYQQYKKKFLHYMYTVILLCIWNQKLNAYRLYNNVP